MDNLQLGLIIVVILGAALLALALWCRKQITVQQQRLALLQAQLDGSQQQWSNAQTETEELRAGIIGVGQRVLLLQEQQQTLLQQLQQVQEQQQALALNDPDSKIYSRAMKMVELGADLEEIIRECELPQAEAELLYNLHQQKQR